MGSPKGEAALSAAVGISVVSALVATLAACQATVPATDEHRELFAGEYVGSLAGGLEATLEVTPNLEFAYSEESGSTQRIGHIRRTGTLWITGPKSARAGIIKLHWRTVNLVDVQSPYGSDMVGDDVGGRVQQRGSSFTIRRAVGRPGRAIELQGITLRPKGRSFDCQAQVSISYAQLHDRIRVDATVENDGCAASSGDYTVRVRTIDDGEARTRTFAESWARQDAAPVKTRRYYDMDGDQKLVWAQVGTSRKTNCRCDENVPADAEATED